MDLNQRVQVKQPLWFKIKRYRLAKESVRFNIGDREGAGINPLFRAANIFWGGSPENCKI